MTKFATFPAVAMPLAVFPRTGWRWPNFSPEEMACKDGTILLHPASLDKLQRLRNRLARPLVIHSAYRSGSYNKRVGGAPGSMHLAARAYDVSMKGHDPAEFEAAARACGFTGFGFYPDQGFIHIDTGPAREWGDRWPDYEDEAPAPPPMVKILQGAEAEAKLAEVNDDLQSVGLGGKIVNPLKRKLRAA